SVHHIWCPLSSQEYQDLPDGAETTLTEIRRLQKELKRVTDERDILKKAALDVRLPEQFSIIGKLRARYPVATL
ncbi:hypothetical protein ABMY80_27435, partial [Klebsiella pneumoniae]